MGWSVADKPDGRIERHPGTSSISLPSRGFYEGRGYTIVESCSDYMGGGERLDYCEAEKRLDGRHST